MKQLWKDRLYDYYVSSGQANIGREDTSLHFSSRQPYIQMVIRKHIPLEKNVRILDLGCGHGAFLHFLMQSGYQNIFGVDISAEQVALAQHLGVNCVEHRGIFSYLASVEDETADVVLLIDVLEHLTRQELFEMLEQVYRILRPGGKCIAHVPNASGLYGMHMRYGDLTHEMAFTPQSIKQAFNSVGFNNINCYEDKPVVHGIVSAFRRLIWNVGTLPFRLLLAAETGSSSFVLSQNMLITSIKAKYESTQREKTKQIYSS